MEKTASIQNDRIESLENELYTLHQLLEEEQQVSAELEKISGLLRKKSMLEEDRMKKLEENLSSVLESRNDLEQELKDHVMCVPRQAYAAHICAPYRLTHARTRALHCPGRCGWRSSLRWRCDWEMYQRFDE